VVIKNFNVLSPSLGPSETDAPLVVYPDAVLPLPIAREGLEPVARWNSQVIQKVSGIDHQEFAMCGSLNLLRQL
jgi:hypothetical protein